MKSLLRTLLYVTALLMCTTTTVISANNQSTIATAVPTTAVPISAVTNNELAVVKAELAASRHFQEQVLNTVYWSLGTIAGLAILLVGYGWWTNSRVYDRDKQALERELKFMITDEVKKLSDQHRDETESKIQDITASIKENLKVGEARIEIKLKELIETVKSDTIGQLRKIKMDQDNIRNNIRELQLSDILDKRLKEMTARTYRNALQSSVSALKLSIEMDDEYQIGDVLDLVAADINSILTSNPVRPVDNFLIGQLVEVLDSVKGNHAHVAAELKAKAPQLLSGKSAA